MPFESMTTLSAGQVLSAEWLNTLGRNSEYLHGLMNQINPPFAGESQSGFTFDANDWFIRHRHRYLHWRIKVERSVSRWRVWYDSTLLVDIDPPWTAGTHSGYIDLNSFSFTENQWYRLRVAIDLASDDTTELRVEYLFESEKV
jgi:hypothetical protein